MDRKKRFNLHNKTERPKLLEMVKASGCEVIIYDCLSSMHEADENKNDQMRGVLDTYSDINAKLGTSCILIHHFGKPNLERPDEYNYRGASAIIDWPDTLMNLRAKKHRHKTLRLLTVTHMRNGPTPKPLLLERDEHLLLNVVEEDSLCPPSKVRDLLYQLGGDSLSKDLQEAITEEVQCSKRTAIKYIKNAEQMEFIKHRTEGKNKFYFISEGEE
jgi:hypothetical protein